MKGPVLPLPEGGQGPGAGGGGGSASLGAWDPQPCSRVQPDKKLEKPSRDNPGSEKLRPFPRLWLRTNNGLCTGREHIALSGSPRASAFSWALMTLQVTQWTLASRLRWLNWEVSWAEAESSDRFRSQREIPPRPSDCPCSTSLNHNAAPVAQTPAGAIPDWNLLESPQKKQT